MKFAFIARFEGLEGEYTAICDKGDNYNQFFGVDSIESGKALVQKLEKDGYELVNLCGDFDAAVTEDIIASTEGKIRIKYSDYMPEEMKKIEALEDLSQYGVIVIDRGLEETAAYEIKDEVGNTYIRFIKDIDGACEAAKELVNETGVTFIELCSWFDAEKAGAVIDAIEGKVPVGTCGEI